MHSWGLYNGRYGLSNMVLIDKIGPQQRPLAERMLDGELQRQKKLKDELAEDEAAAAWLDERHVFQNYKQLQFFDLLALYFNRTHASERGELKFDHVPLNAREDVTITVRPTGDGVYSLSPYPFAAENASFAYAGRPIAPGQQDSGGHWTGALAAAATVWETFRLVAA
jgi:hypothetical protein